MPVNGMFSYVLGTNTGTPLYVALTDGYGNPIGSYRNSINIHASDVHYEIVNEQFSQATATTTTLDSAVSAGDTSISTVSALSVGDQLIIENGSVENPFPIVTAVSGTGPYAITLDSPLDYDHPVGTSVTKTLVNMAVAGSLTSPQSFKVQPLSGEVMHLTRILIEMTHGTAGDNGLFGNLAALKSGCVLRYYNGATGQNTKFTNWKTNSDMVTDMYDVTYSSRSGGGGAYGTNCRGTFKNADAIIRLDGDAGDYLELLVQDDLSGLVSFRIKAQGHFEVPNV